MIGPQTLPRASPLRNGRDAGPRNTQARCKDTFQSPVSEEANAGASTAVSCLLHQHRPRRSWKTPPACADQGAFTGPRARLRARTWPSRAPWSEHRRHPRGHDFHIGPRFRSTRQLRECSLRSTPAIAYQFTAQVFGSTTVANSFRRLGIRLGGSLEIGAARRRRRGVAHIGSAKRIGFFQRSPWRPARCFFPLFTRHSQVQLPT